MISTDGARILVVDDEVEITQVIRTVLISRGYQVKTEDDGESALKVFREWHPHLVVTDLSMPKMGGIGLCQAIRTHGNVPIIVLSVKDQESIKVQALESGADDYVTKPFGMDELLARVKAALRRSAALPSPENVLRNGDFFIDIAAHRVEIRGTEVHLTPKEFTFLVFLLRNAGKVLTPKNLLSAIWGRTYTDQSDAVRALVRQLRKKIELDPEAPKYLKTEPWVGYRFSPGD